MGNEILLTAARRLETLANGSDDLQAVLDARHALNLAQATLAGFADSIEHKRERNRESVTGDRKALREILDLYDEILKNEMGQSIPNVSERRILYKRISELIGQPAFPEVLLNLCAYAIETGATYHYNSLDDVLDKIKFELNKFPSDRKEPVTLSAAEVDYVEHMSETVRSRIWALAGPAKAAA